MGAYSPVPFAGADVVDEVMDKAIAPTLGELARRGAEYRGVLYCGIMLTPEGTKVVEYNIRFGDPECQVIVPRLASDLYAHCHEAAAGRIETPVVMTDDACVGIALAPEGYPPAPLRTGEPIGGLGAAAAVEGALVFHAGTKLVDGEVVDRRGPRPHDRGDGADDPCRPGPRVRRRGRDLVARPPLPSRHRSPSPHMIPRYSLPEIAELFTDEARFGAWLDVEVLAVEA